jgi:hypothetical protein
VLEPVSVGIDFQKDNLRSCQSSGNPYKVVNPRNQPRRLAMPMNYSDEERERWRQKVEADDKSFAAADQKLATAIREYLWEQVQITGTTEWETEPDYALLAVARVVLQHICYQPLDYDDEDDDEIAHCISSGTEELIADLDDLGWQRRRHIKLVH